MQELLQRAHDIAELAASDDETLDRAALQEEFNGIMAEVERISAREDVAQLLAAGGGDSGGILHVEVEIDGGTDVSQAAESAGTNKTITYGNGTTKDLSEVLQKEIVPQIVKNLLSTYSAFNYLAGRDIKIGLSLASIEPENGSMTLAYVAMKSEASGNYTQTSTTTGNVTSMQSTLRLNLTVNTKAVTDTSRTSESMSQLESTIAHEMIHAFMDIALTSGMTGTMFTGTVSNTGSGWTFDQKPSSEVAYPSWFKEGLAQTASGPGNWLQSSGGLKITKDSTVDQIATAISNNKLSDNTTPGNYGTGYLACMYLGAAIAGGGTPGTVDATTISSGLNQLLHALIGGSSVNDAIKTLTGGKFTSLTDFRDKFDNLSGDLKNEVGGFVQNLLTATGDGLGGLATKDLSASDLAENAETSSGGLFALQTGTNGLNNFAENTFNTNEFTGGGISTENPTTPVGYAPPDPPPPPTPGFGMFNISSSDTSKYHWDATTNTLTIDEGAMGTVTLAAGADKSTAEKSSLGVAAIPALR